MEPMGIIGLITAGIPFATSLLKKVFRTGKLENKKRKGINTLLPIIIGILSAGLYAFSQGQDWVTALAIGLGSGGAASSARDIEKNLIRMVEAIGQVLKKS
jgi:hypothetical protein